MFTLHCRGLIWSPFNLSCDMHSTPVPMLYYAVQYSGKTCPILERDRRASEDASGRSERAKIGLSEGARGHTVGVKHRPVSSENPRSALSSIHSIASWQEYKSLCQVEAMRFLPKTFFLLFPYDTQIYSTVLRCIWGGRPSEPVRALSFSSYSEKRARPILVLQLFLDSM